MNIYFQFFIHINGIPLYNMPNLKKMKIGWFYKLCLKENNSNGIPA